VPTHTFDTAPDDIEVLIVPGGFGSRQEENIDGVIEFVRARYGKLRWLLTVCTGSAIVAKSGILDGRRATSNKRAFSWVCPSVCLAFLLLFPAQHIANSKLMPP
jgi:putative intracellular protease/amidase